MLKKAMLALSAASLVALPATSADARHYHRGYYGYGYNSYGYAYPRSRTVISIGVGSPYGYGYGYGYPA